MMIYDETYFDFASIKLCLTNEHYYLVSQCEIEIVLLHVQVSYAYDVKDFGYEV